MKTINQLLSIAIMLTMAIGFVSCGDKDEPSSSNASSTKGEWYVSPGGFATAADFAEINEAIDNHELLSKKYGIYAEVSEFITPEGMFSDLAWELGRLRGSLGGKCAVTVCHIIDDATIEMYHPWLYLDSGPTNSEGKRIWYFDAGRHFGKMAYYSDSPTICIYTKMNNTLVLSNGDVFIKTSEGLQGDYGVWKKFTPKF